jgi:flagellar assembly protein FliH
MNETAVRKFSFDTVFEDNGRVIAPPRPKKVFTPEEVEQVRREAFAEGERSALAVAQQAQTLAVQQIAAAAQGALGSLAMVAHQHRAGSAHLALAAARKIADAALERFPEAPAAAALDALAREVEAVPRLVARCAPDQLDGVKEALEGAAHSAGYPGQIVVRADPALPTAAFVLDWGDGSAAFDPNAAADRVAQALDEALAAEGFHAESLSHPNMGHPNTGYPNEADHG